ncbi:hypothetical protein PybrP1_002356 [[Pythium] brassicae (nom. inval.)]|nr:hypothetical protein PybrP1_002356 [[Pythium] brassicae (nom. inval.)]
MMQMKRDAGGGGAASATATELDTYAQWAWLSGRVGEAVELYQELARAYKCFPHVHFKLGFLFLTLQDFEGAVRHFSVEIERFAEADSPAREHSAREKTFLLCACVGRSEAFAALHDAAKAESDRLFVANRGGTARPVLVAMGVLFARLGMHVRAESCFERCAAADADDPDYLLAHAELRLAQKRFAQAAKLFEKCRTTCSASSATYHRALIGEGAALLRQSKYQEAVILLLQAMNTLRASIRSLRGGGDASAGDELREHLQLYHHATNLYGGLCLLKGELKAALDAYCSVLQRDKQAPGASDAFDSSSDERFQLPTLCVLPGTRDLQGDLVDSTTLSAKNLGEVVRHLSELERRYGPDPCVYFHRANAHKALGDVARFVRDLSLVESLDPAFMAAYTKRAYGGDFLDVETVAWVPLAFVSALHSSLERREHAVPTAERALSSSSSRQLSPRARSPSKRSAAKAGANATALPRPPPRISEAALFVYFQQRIQQSGAAVDEYAHVFQLDVLRRLPVPRRKANSASLATQHLAPWEGAVFDEQPATTATAMSGETSGSDVRERIKSVLSKFGQNACVHMLAGVVELERFNASVAHIYFTEALALVAASADAAASGTMGSSSSSSSGAQSSLARRWQQRVLDRVRFYCLLWRSLASRIKIEMEKAVEDLNVAAAIQLDPLLAAGDADEPLLLVQRTLIMLLNGHLKSALKLLRQLARSLRRTQRETSNRTLRRDPHDDDDYDDWLLVVDMFGNAGLNSFNLLPRRLERAVGRVSSPGRALSTSDASDRGGCDSEAAAFANNDNNDDDDDDGQQALRKGEETAAAIVRYALSKKSPATGGRVGASGLSGVLQIETLDRLFESGLLKLAASGSLAQATPFLLAVLSIDEQYLPPTNFASLELLKCKEAEVVEEKLFACFVRLGKRSKWLHQKARWPFEAFIDANLAHAYLPGDLDTLWHRARLLTAQGNFVSAANDLSTCLELLWPHLTWEKRAKAKATTGSSSVTSTKVKAVFATETKRTQWLQLLLERGRLEMALGNWERAVEDLSLVVQQAGKRSRGLEVSAVEARSSALIQLNRLGPAIQDLQHLLQRSVQTQATTAGADNEDEDALLNHILVGNLYCHLALNQLSAAQSLAPALRLTSGSVLAKADAHYASALALSPDHFLPHYFRGRLLALAGLPTQATACFSECLRRHPVFLPALFLRGCIYAQQRLAVLALADLYRVRHRAPAYPRLHTSIGVCHYNGGSMAKAIEALTEAAQQDPADVDALYVRGCALQELFALEGAIKDFSRVLTLAPAHVSARYQRSVCYVLVQRYDDARVDLERALELRNEWHDAWNLHAYACFCQARYEDAVLSYGRAIGGHRDAPGAGGSQGQRDSQLFLHRSLANVGAERYAEALQDVDLALKRDSANYVAFVAKASMLGQVGERERAVQLLLHALPHYKAMALRSASDAAPVSPDAVFAHRKRTREAQEQRAQAHQQGRLEALATAPARADADAPPVQPKLPGPLALASRRRTLVGASLAASTEPAAGAVALPEWSDPPSPAAQRRARATKFHRAIKKLSAEHRVLKALENATAAKYKKNELRRRVLAELLRAPSAVAWPRGAMTTNVLVWAFNVVGTHHLRARRVEEALKAFSLAIQAQPHAPATLFNRGTAFLHMDALPSAVSGFQDALEADERCFQAQTNLGVALFRLKRLEDAHDALATALLHVAAPKPKAVVLYNLGVVLQHLEKPDDAMEFYQQAIALDGSRTEFFTNRSSILHQQLKFTVALDDYNRALALEDGGDNSDDSSEGDGAGAAGRPSGIEARLNRAQLFITMGNCTSAIADLNAVLAALGSAREADAKRNASVRGTPSSESQQPMHKAAEAAADEALALELLAFCCKWKQAIRIAVKDFLFGLDALRVFASLELYAAFGPQLGAPLLSIGGDELAESTALPLCPLPIADPSFFDFERELVEWRTNDDDEDDGDQREGDDAGAAEEEKILRTCKKQLLQPPLGAFLRDAVRLCATGAFDDAARCLLRAHYKTPLDSPEEYVLVVWRAQVLARLDSSPHSADSGLRRAVTLLHAFLTERQQCDEVQDGTDVTGPTATTTARVVRSNTRLEDDDAAELSAQELKWRQQRRIIRADAYTFLGSLQQLDGQPREARRSFAHALRLRGDHIVALLNLLQLSIVDREYEAALDCVVRVVGLVFGRATTRETNSSRPTESQHEVVGAAEPRGLLGARRAVEWMLPGVAAARDDPEWRRIGGQLLQLLNEYKGLLSAHIQSNTAHIFRKQGALARLVEDARQLQCRNDAQASVVVCGDTDSALPAAVPLDLDAINRILDEYTASILHEPLLPVGAADDASEPAAASTRDELKAAFLAELSLVCDQVARSLPPEALVATQPERPPPLDTVATDASESTSQPPSPKSSQSTTAAARPLRSPGSAASRKASVLVAGSRRPTAVSLSARPHRRSTTASSSNIVVLASQVAAATAAGVGPRTPSDWND